MRRIYLLVVTCVMMLVAPIHAENDVPFYVRLAHLSVDAPAVDLHVNGRASQIEDLSFGETGEWYTLPADRYDILISAKDLGNLVEIDDFGYPAGEWVTLALIGSWERGTLTLRSLIEDYSELTAGEAQLSVFHAIEGVSGVDVLLNGSTLFQYINYPGSTGSNDGIVSTDVIANVYDLQVVLNHDPQVVLIDLAGIQLAPRHYYFVGLTGTPDNPLFTLASTQREEVEARPLRTMELAIEGNGRLRLAHVASGAPNLDVYINGELSAIRNVPFGALSDFVALPAGERQIVIAASGDSLQDGLVAPLEVDLKGGAWLTLATIGAVENDSLAIQVLEEDFSPLEDRETRVSVLQAIAGIPPVNVRLGDGTTMIRLLGYPGSQGDNDGYESFDLAAGSYDVRVVSAADPGDVVVELHDMALLEGRHYFIALVRAEPPYVLTSMEMVRNE